MSYDSGVKLWWAYEDADRSARYPGAMDIDPAWAQEVLIDDDLLELSPYPSSRMGAIGLVGYSASAVAC